MLISVIFAIVRQNYDTLKLRFWIESNYLPDFLMNMQTVHALLSKTKLRFHTSCMLS